MTLLRAGLLDGNGVVLAGSADGTIAAGLQGLGARVQILEEQTEHREEDVGQWAREHGPLRAVVYDARASFGDGGPDALNNAMQQAWQAVREIAVGALIESPEPGKVVLIGPGRDIGQHAEAAGAALENLARTLSVEWARHGITTVMIAPGLDCPPGELAEVVAYLCSRGGDYFSGCRLEVGLGRR
jgi:NAD(P)-dependent dehydrogenase (short-subunit alcohol dehydrogenase family)